MAWKLALMSDDTPTNEPTSERCNGETKKGGACPNLASPGRPYCLAHDPDRAEERRQRMAELGKGSAKARQAVAAKKVARRISLKTTDDIREALEVALGKVKAGEEGAVHRANATARLCGVALDILKDHEIEREVAELRQVIETRLGPNWRTRLS
jgi:hypothetical protein